MSAPLEGQASTPPSRRWFWPALVLGWAIMAVGVVEALHEPNRASVGQLVTFLVAFALVHDVVVAPLVLLVGWALATVLPRSITGPVRAGAALGAIVVLFSIPLLTAWGRRPGNSSTLPLDYGRNVLLVLGAIALVATGAALMRSWAPRRARRSPR